MENQIETTMELAWKLEICRGDRGVYRDATMSSSYGDLVIYEPWFGSCWDSSAFPELSHAHVAVCA